MLPTPKAGGCSGDARPSGPRWRLTGLPGPTHVLRRVFVAVQHQPAGRTDVEAWVRTDRLLATRCVQRLPSGSTPLHSWVVYAGGIAST
jgi:hypothetical protein